MRKKPNTAKQASAAPAAVPFVEILIGGMVYKMTISYRALAAAEDELHRRGHDVNILRAKVKPTLSGVRSMFAASLLHYQPELAFEDAQDLVSDDNIGDVLFAFAGIETKDLPAPAAAESPVSAGEAVHG